MPDDLHERESWWSRLAPAIAGIAMVIIMVCLPTIVWQEYHYYQLQRGFHAQTVKILNEHTNTLQDVQQLRMEVTNLVKQYGPALTAGQTALINKLDWLICVHGPDALTCGPAPPA